MASEPDEYQVAKLVSGFPLCTFSPKPYTRKITNIVIANGASGEVRCYRGNINSIPVARNSKGDSNTIGGGLKVPAGQLFFVQWQNSGTPVSSATARVSWDRVEGNFEGGDSVLWSEEFVGRIVVPSDGETNPSAPPYIIIANSSDQSGNDFASIIFRTPTLPAGYEYRVQIRKGVAPFVAQFDIVLWNTNTNARASGLIRQNYNSVASRLDTVVGPSVGDTGFGQETYLWGHQFIYIQAMDPALAGRIAMNAQTIVMEGQFDPSFVDLAEVQIGAGNTNPPLITLHNKELGFNVENIHMLTPPAPAGLSSATPITITGASTTSFTKAYANTRVEVYMSGGGFIAAGAGASVTFGILISGGIGDFSIVKGSFSVLSNRIQFSGTRLLTAFAAGTYTITPRWFRNAGTSTITMDATDASLTVSIREVKEA